MYIKDPPPLPLSYPRVDRFPRKLPRGELRGYYGILLHLKATKNINREKKGDGFL